MRHKTLAGIDLIPACFIVVQKARTGAKFTHMTNSVRKYLGLTLLPHSGVSLVFTGIICSTLASAPELVKIIQGTVAAVAVINEFIAVIAVKKGFELEKEIKTKHEDA